MLVGTIEKLKSVSVGYVGTNGLFDSATVNAYTASLRGLSATQAEVALSSAGLDKAQKQQILNKLAETNATVSLTSAEATEALTRSLGSKEVANELLVKSGLVTEEQLLAGATIEVTNAKIADAVATGVLTKEEGLKISTAFGLTGANIGLGTSFKLLGKSIWATTKALLTNPWTWAIVGVVALVAGISKAITTTKEYREKLEDIKSEASEIESELSSLNSELETTKQRMEELEGKGSLTFTEKEEYDNLVKQNNELQRSIDLLELEAKTKNKEKNKAFIDMMNSDVQGSGEYAQDSSGNILKGSAGLYGFIGGMSGSTETYSISSEDAYINQQFEERQKLLEEKRKAETKEEKERIQSQIDEIDTYLQSKSTQWSSDAEGIAYISNPTTEDDKAVNAWLDYIADFQDSMAIVMGGDNAKTNTFNRVVDNWQFDDTVQGLQDLGKEGKVTADMLDDPKYDEFINKLVFLGVIDSADNLEDVALAFNNIGKSADDASDSASNFGNKFDDSRTKMISSINDMSEGFEELDKIYSSIKDDDPFDFKLLDDDNFKETFSELESYADFIEQITSNSDDIEACQSAFNKLVTEWITSTKVLDNVTKENEKLTVAMLKQMGISNAETLVTNALNRAKIEETAIEEYLTAQKESASISSKTLADATFEEINAMLAEGYATETTIEYLNQLALAKLDVNNLKLNTDSDVDNIIAIANAAGTSAKYIDALKTALEKLRNAQSIKQTGISPAGKIAAEAVAKAEINNILSQIQNTKLNASDFYANAKYNGGSTSNKGGSGGDTKEEFDHIETLISRLQRSITNFGKTVSATWKSWTDRNSALKSQISAVTQEINLQQQAADKYWALAESVSGVGNYKGLIQKGALDISTVTDENTIDAIKQYQEYYEAYLSCLDAKQDAQDELASLVREDFDLIAKQFDIEISLVEANISTLEAYIDQTEMKGNLVSKNYYSAMYAQEQKNLSLLQQKYDQLSNKLSNGSIAEGSEEFNEMAKEIKEVSKAIIESTTALEEYQKTMRELDWEVFDLGQEKISNLIIEGEFLIELLSNSKLFNDDGSITSQGQATLGLHVANMRIYESQISDYAQAIADLDKEFANDSLDQDYLARRQELVELQRDSILNCENEKSAIKDLYSDGMDNLLSYMDELIAKRKSLLSQASDARSFQKTIQEQTSEIDRLQTIIGSYGENLSEEDRAIVQKHQVSLEQAEQDLEDTLYDKYISDQEQILDALADDANQWVNERLDKIDSLIEDVVSATDANAETIKTTLEKEVSSVNGSLTKEMQNLWSGADGIKGVVGGVNDTLLDIKNLVQSMIKGSDAEASKNASGATTNTTPATKPVTTPSTSNTNSNSSTTTKAITVGGMINASGALIYDYVNDKSGERQFYRNDPIYKVLEQRGEFLKVRHHKLSSGTTGWFKKSDVKAYKTGGLVDETGLAWLDGTKGKPELVLKPNDTENYLKLTEALRTAANTNMFDAIQSYAKLPNFVPNATNNNQQAMIIQGDIVLEGVQSPEDLAKKMKEIYQGDISHVRKTIRADVYGGMLGKNSLTRYKY